MAEAKLGLPPRNPNNPGGKIENVSLAEAVANGQIKVIKFLVEESKVDLDKPGDDGTTALCAASLWGSDKIVGYLLDKGADIDARNTATNWSPLHAATFQEHGKVVRLLLEKGANVLSEDHKGRTPKDYASISEAIWSFFEAKGCVRSTKDELVKKGIIKKSKPESKAAESKRASNGVVKYSRPGSAYVRCSYNPLRPMSANYKKEPEASPHSAALGRVGMDSQMPGSDPLGDEPDDDGGGATGASDLNFKGLGL